MCVCARARACTRTCVCVLLCRSAICSFTWHIDDYEKTKTETNDESNEKQMLPKIYDKKKRNRQNGGRGTARKLNENCGRTPAPLPYPCIVAEHITIVDDHGTYCRRTAYIAAGDNICCNRCVCLSPIIRIPKLSCLFVSVSLSLSRFV